MATKAHRRSRRSRRLDKKFDAHWLLVLLARTLASLLLMVVTQWLHLPSCGG
jgi:hypothetical protein